MITGIRDTIQAQLNPNYVAVITPYITLESIEITPTRQGFIPTRYARIEIRSVTHETLITSIELLSPANKRPGAEGADAYETKRQEIFQSGVHLLEIDLLRGGVRPRLTQSLPPVPYFVFLSRSYRRPLVDVWPIALRDPIPVVPVPLTYPDPDVPLDLNRVLHQVYRNARYERQVDYGADPPPPDLSPADATWLDAHLREKGLRD